MLFARVLMIPNIIYIREEHEMPAILFLEGLPPEAAEAFPRDERYYDIFSAN